MRFSALPWAMAALLFLVIAMPLVFAQGGPPLIDCTRYNNYEWGDARGAQGQLLYKYYLCITSGSDKAWTPAGYYLVDFDIMTFDRGKLPSQDDLQYVCGCWTEYYVCSREGDDTVIGICKPIYKHQVKIVKMSAEPYYINVDGQTTVNVWVVNTNEVAVEVNISVDIAGKKTGQCTVSGNINPGPPTKLTARVGKGGDAGCDITFAKGDEGIYKASAKITEPACGSEHNQRGSNGQCASQNDSTIFVVGSGMGDMPIDEMPAAIVPVILAIVLVVLARKGKKN